jgi:hypothetical protein
VRAAIATSSDEEGWGRHVAGKDLVGTRTMEQQLVRTVSFLGFGIRIKAFADTDPAGTPLAAVNLILTKRTFLAWVIMKDRVPCMQHPFVLASTAVYAAMELPIEIGPASCNCARILESR